MNKSLHFGFVLIKEEEIIFTPNIILSLSGMPNFRSRLEPLVLVVFLQLSPGSIFVSISKVIFIFLDTSVGVLEPGLRYCKFISRAGVAWGHNFTCLPSSRSRNFEQVWGIVQALPGTYVRYLCAFQSGIPVLDNWPSNVYQLWGKPQGQLRKGLWVVI